MNHTHIECKRLQLAQEEKVCTHKHAGVHPDTEDGLRCVPQVGIRIDKARYSARMLDDGQAVHVRKGPITNGEVAPKLISTQGQVKKTADCLCPGLHLSSHHDFINVSSSWCFVCA